MKKYLIAITVFAIALTAVAFKSQKSHDVKDHFQFFYYEMTSGLITDGDARVIPGNYSKANGDGTSLECTPGSQRICQIYAEDNGSGLPLIGTSGDLYDALYNGDATVPDALNEDEKVFLRLNP